MPDNSITNGIEDIEDGAMPQNSEATVRDTTSTPPRKTSRSTRRVNPGAPRRSSQVTNFKTTNHSTSLVTTKFYNQSFITQPFRVVTDETILFPYMINPILSRLNKQAQVFARKLISMQEIEWRYVLNQYPETWQGILENTYIYSYFKCLLYAVSDQRIAEIPDDFYCITGHSIMYNALKRSSFSFECDSIFVTYKHVCSAEHYTKLLGLARSYDYIDSCLQSDTRFYLENEYYDRFLRRIAAEMKGTKGPHFVEMTNSQNVKRYLTQDNFPLINTFYAQDSKGKVDENIWKYSFNQKTKIHSDSMLFGKAIFATELKDNLEVYDYFDKITVSDQSSLVKYEVSSVAGSTYPNYKEDSTTLK